MVKIRKRTVFAAIALIALAAWIFYSFARQTDRLGWHCNNTCMFEENGTTFLVLEAYVDEENRQLMGNEEYLIEGVSLPAEDWTMTLYVKNLPFTVEGRGQSVKKSEVKKNPYGLWQVHLSSALQKEGVTLLNTGKKEPIKLVLRLEEPEPYLIRWGNIFTSPTIKRVFSLEPSVAK